jgi:hypothetical protein
MGRNNDAAKAAASTTTAGWSGCCCAPPQHRTYLTIGQDLFSIHQYLMEQYNASLHSTIRNQSSSSSSNNNRCVREPSIHSPSISFVCSSPSINFID